jgi:hypothetical protein
VQITSHQKILSQARQGLQSFENINQEERQEAITKPLAQPSNNEAGILVLEPINNEQKTLAAPKFAQVTQIYRYTARLILPSYYWKVYRMGKTGELEFYGAQLQQAGIPCCWLNIAQIKQIQVYQVKYFSEWPSKPTVFCQNSKN